MQKLEIVKAAAEIVTSLGVGSVVGNAIKRSTPENAKVLKKISIGIGGFVITSMVSDMATKYVTTSIDSVAAQINSIIKPTN